jgi:hypothetical protein
MALDSVRKPKMADITGRKNSDSFGPKVNIQGRSFGVSFSASL